MSVSKAAAAVISMVTLLGAVSASAADNTAVKTEPLKVCAVPQMYNYLSRLELNNSLNIDPTIATSEEILADIVNTEALSCDVVLSADERLPAELIRSGKASKDSLQPFAEVKLILWSVNPRLMNQDDILQTVKSGRIRSVALPKAEFTPVGFAAEKSYKELNFGKYFADSTYRTDNEYQVYSMVREGNVDAGFISKPLVSALTRMANGSYYEVPTDMYPAIRYYAVITEKAGTSADPEEALRIKRAADFIKYLREDSKNASLMSALGLDSLHK